MPDNTVFHSVPRSPSSVSRSTAVARLIAASPEIRLEQARALLADMTRELAELRHITNEERAEVSR